MPAPSPINNQENTPRGEALNTGEAGHGGSNETTKALQAKLTEELQTRLTRQIQEHDPTPHAGRLAPVGASGVLLTPHWLSVADR